MNKDVPVVGEEVKREKRGRETGWEVVAELIKKTCVEYSKATN